MTKDFLAALRKRNARFFELIMSAVAQCAAERVSVN